MVFYVKLVDYSNKGTLPHSRYITATVLYCHSAVEPILTISHTAVRLFSIWSSLGGVLPQCRKWFLRQI